MSSRPDSSARIEKRTFEQRTMRYADVRDMMEEARPDAPRKSPGDGEQSR